MDKLSNDKSFYRPINDTIAQHARPLITLLEQKIHDEFGFDIQIGCEKEFYLKLKGVPATSVNSQEHFAMDIQQRIGERFAQKTSKESVTQRFYSEAPPEQYEFTTAPASPLRAVVRLDGQCQLLEHIVQTRRLFPLSNRSKTIIGTQIPLKEQGFRAEQVDFNPFSFGVFSGLHINVSVWKDADNLTGKLYSTNDIVGARRWLNHYAHTDTLLIAPSVEAYQRLAHIEIAMRYKTGNEANQDRLEFRLPSSDARHDLSVLLTMTAIYQWLHQKTLPAISISDDYLPENKAEAMKRFKDSQIMKDLEAIVQGDDHMQIHVAQLRNAIATCPDLRQPQKSRSLQR